MEHLQENESGQHSRRGFFFKALSAPLGLASVMGVGGAAIFSPVVKAGNTVQSLLRGASQALQHRVHRATVNLTGRIAPPALNNDESLSGFIGSYAKGLPHNDAGEVDPAAYRLLLQATRTGTEASYAAIPMGGTAKQVSPQASIALQMEGQTSANLRLPAAPAFSSEQRAAEMNEVYWMALLRDVPFSQYHLNPMVSQASDDLRRYALFNTVTPQTLFRGITSGEKRGHYVSQFLWRTVPYAMTTIPQKYAVGIAGRDFMTSPVECMQIQRGVAPTQALTMDGNPHYIRNGRDLAEYVHRDFSYQAFLNAALIGLGYGANALDENNPNRNHTNRTGFVTFGGPDILSMVAQVGVLALKAAWYQKWQLHRTLRPEAFGLRVQQHRNGGRSYPIHQKLLDSPVLGLLQAKNASLCLPMAYAEGSPLHPSYPAGHATIAGACTTVLKAFFNESFVLPDPVVASDDGSSLLSYSGEPLTMGGELDKLAANVSIGRNIAGVHYWSDGIEGMRLGEQVALAFLADQRSTYAEAFAGFKLTTFDGRAVVV